MRARAPEMGRPLRTFIPSNTADITLTEGNGSYVRD